MSISNIITKIKLKKWVKNGLKVGENFQIERDVFIDPSFPWLVTIGSNVTIAPECLILCHDGSTKKLIGYSKIGKVSIGNDVFIGAKSVVLPNVKIGNNCVIGAGSVITKDIPDGSVAVGVPARVIMTTEEYKKSNENLAENRKMFSSEYTIKGGISDEKKKEMIEILNENSSFVI
ncbi:MAG: acyltransferase [Clostridia bacterium]